LISLQKTQNEEDEKNEAEQNNEEQEQAIRNAN